MAQRWPAVVDMEALAQESLEMLAPVAHAKWVQLNLESPKDSTIQGDAEALRMFVDNLVGNAIKYAPVNRKEAVFFGLATRHPLKTGYGR